MSKQIRRILSGVVFVWLVLTWIGGSTLPIHGSATTNAPMTVLSACDPIGSNTTWSAANLYLANNCAVIIPAGVTLTVEPGTTVKFLGDNAVMIVQGTLDAQGTAAQPITFSSVNDDAHGQAAPGSSASPAAEDWYGIHFAPDSNGQIHHAFVGYGTAYSAPPVVGWNKGQIYAEGATLDLHNLEVAHGHRPGLFLRGNDNETAITDSVIHHHTASSPPYGAAIYQESIHWQPSYNNLTFNANDRNEVTIGDFRGDLTEDVTLGGTRFGVICGYTLCQLNIPDGRTLTVAPGTQIDFGRAYGIGIAGGGSLIAEGTATQPITFTSQLAAAGDLNQYWLGIWAKAGSSLRLDHCDISYADDGNFGNGGLEINSDDAEVNHCQIHHNRRTGLYLYSRDGATIHPTLTQVDVTDNGQSGVYLGASYGGSLRVTWDEGSISRNGWSGVEDYTWVSSLYLTLRNLSVDQNGALGDSAARRRGLSFVHHSVHPDLENVSFDGNEGEAIHWFCNGSITARDLTATNNGSDELLIPGCGVGGASQWNLGEVGIPVRVSGGVNVETNALLSLQPGTVLRFDKNQYGSSIGILVNSNAALYALGTADDPVVFTGTTETPGWWLGIAAAYDHASLILDQCEVAYGGHYHGNIYAYGHSEVSPSPVQIQNCKIHQSAHKGLKFDWVWTEPPLIRHNQIYDNEEEGITNWNAPALDARQNYWGDPSGPFHATQNPTGQGQSVGDNVLFYPWLSAPPSGETTPGQMLVSTGAPKRVSPGETVDYAIQYVNGMMETARNGLLVVQLPGAAEYVTSSGGGVYWPERDQLFWALGDLPPGSQGFLTFQLRFGWGLPRDYHDSSITLFTADNVNPGELTIQPYLDYEPGGVDGISLLSRPQFDAQLAASPALQAAYNAAVGAGYSYHSAANITRSEGGTALEVVMVASARRATRILAVQSGQLLIYTITPAEVIIENGDGGMRFDLLTGEKREWGEWAADEGASVLSGAVDACTPDACKRNCRWTILGWAYIKKKAGRVIAWTALAPFTGGGSVAGAVWEIGSTAKKLYDCDLDCQADPSAYCCTAGQVRWSGGGVFGGLTNSCYREKCNAATGVWVPDGYKTCIAFGQRCVAGVGGPGCAECEEQNSRQQIDVQTVTVAAPLSTVDLCGASATGKPRCRDLDLRLAKDPNAITGVDGDLLPGQIVTYTIRYENEGAGRAYGVYVVNPLPALFDESTLTFVHPNGVYLPDSREIFWLVGELGPQGAADAEGVITYTVALTGGLPSGTVVANEAVVYFPSVPEETPTNTWLNLISPLVAIPQDRVTAYMTPLAITLRGKEASNSPLTFEVVEPPHGGVLTGSAPTLTYTPAQNFTGPDSFSFTVDNGVSTSRAAQVRIEVTAAGDKTPPAVLWTIPTADETSVVASISPVFTDTVGPLYSPTILIGLSEALDPSTVTTATVTLAGSEGSIPALIGFDAASNQIVVRPRAALIDDGYTVTVSATVTDLAGNGLTAPYTLSFAVGEGIVERKLYLPRVQR